MRRNDIHTVAGAGEYAGKPRPIVIVQDDRFFETDSVSFCAFTSTAVDAPFFRLRVLPSAPNGLKLPSYLMVDKVTTAPRTKIGGRIGRLDDDDVARLNRAIMIFFGLAVPVRTEQE